MKNILLLIVSTLIIGCSSVTGPDPAAIVFPVTYVEWEYRHPLDTTWWTLTADGKCYAAWKRKITEVSGIPAWQPQIYGVYQYGEHAGDTLYRYNSYGQIVDAHGNTKAQHDSIYAAQIAGYLPIQYYAGTWGEKDGLLTLAVNRVVPGTINGVACSMSHATYVETQWAPAYIAYDYWSQDSLHGYQADDEGNPIPTPTSDPDVKFSRWHGQGLNESSNPIFNQF